MVLLLSNNLSVIIVLIAMFSQVLHVFCECTIPYTVSCMWVCNILDKFTRGSHALPIIIVNLICMSIIQYVIIN